MCASMASVVHVSTGPMDRSSSFRRAARCASFSSSPADAHSLNVGQHQEHHIQDALAPNYSSNDSHKHCRPIADHSTGWH